MKINIGTTSGNIVGYEIKKRFKNITYADVRKIADEKIGGTLGIIGWTPTNKRTQKRQRI